MEIKTADFVKSSVRLDQCPEPLIPEYAFIGRSNVGKSSLINMLCSRKGLAKTSSNPGKTQHINHYIINEQHKPWYLVDLPGYGYAKVSKKSRENWMKFIRFYLKKRENLICVFVLIDGRHEAQKVDLEFMEWLGLEAIPFVMVFTKADKLSGQALNRNIKKYNSAMLERWEELPSQFRTSAISGDGKDEIIGFIEETASNFIQPI